MACQENGPRPRPRPLIGMDADLRLVRLLNPPTAEEPGILCITTGKKPTHYAFREVPCDIGGRAFAMHPLGMGVLYHVRVGEGTDCSCECMGFLRHGRCKHIMGLRALMENNLV